MIFGSILRLLAPGRWSRVRMSGINRGARDRTPKLAVQKLLHGLTLQRCSNLQLVPNLLGHITDCERHGHENPERSAANISRELAQREERRADRAVFWKRSPTADGQGAATSLLRDLTRQWESRIFA